MVCFSLCQISLASGSGDSGSLSNPVLHLSPFNNHRHVINLADPQPGLPEHLEPQLMHLGPRDHF